MKKFMKGLLSVAAVAVLASCAADHGPSIELAEAARLLADCEENGASKLPEVTNLEVDVYSKVEANGELQEEYKQYGVIDVELQVARLRQSIKAVGEDGKLESANVDNYIWTDETNIYVADSVTKSYMKLPHGGEAKEYFGLVAGQVVDMSWPYLVDYTTIASLVADFEIPGEGELPPEAEYVTSYSLNSTGDGNLYAKGNVKMVIPGSETEGKVTVKESVVAQIDQYMISYMKVEASQRMEAVGEKAAQEIKTTDETKTKANKGVKVKVPDLKGYKEEQAA